MVSKFAFAKIATQISGNLMAKYDIQTRYADQVVSSLMSEFGYDNVMEVPRIEKIVLNVGVGEAVDNPKSLDGAVTTCVRLPGSSLWSTSQEKHRDLQAA